MNNLFSGARYLLTGFSLMMKPGLRRFIVVPLLINIVLFIALFFLLRHLMSEFNQWFEHFLPAWLHWLGFLLWGLFFLSFATLLLYTFVTLANLISAPFNSFLAEKVEYYLTGKMSDQRTLWENIKDVPRIVGRQLTILGYYLPRLMILFVLFFVPVVQTIAPFLLFLFHAWFMTLTYMDYPTDNHRIAIPDVRTWLQARRWTSLGLGMSILVGSLIPVVNFFIIPAAVAGSTAFWVAEK